MPFLASCRITSLLHCPLVICSLYHLPLGGLRETSRSPPAESRILSPIHSCTAGCPGINGRGNAVNSPAFLLSQWRECCQMDLDARDGPAPTRSSSAGSLCQGRRRRTPSSSAPHSSSSQAGFSSYQIL